MYLSTGCVAHAQSGLGPFNCCAGLTPWTYDAKNGAREPTGTYRCWNATCSPEGQWAGPAGVGNFCCPGLVPVNGKCTQSTPQEGQIPPPESTPPPPTTTIPPTPSKGNGSTIAPDGTTVAPPPVTVTPSLIPGIDNTMLLLGAGGLVLLLMLTKKKGGAR